MGLVLSKGDIQSGLRCEKALYLAVHHSELREEVSPSARNRMENGIHIGELARECFPGGVLIEEDWATSIASTKVLMADPTVPAIFEGVFEKDGIRVKADILRRVGGGFDLIEVKSSSSVKKEHLDDLAIQYHVIKGCDVPLARIFLMHINKEPDSFFHEEEVTDKVVDRSRELPEIIAKFWRVLDGAEPIVEVGSYCKNPHPCQFFDHCHSSLPDDHITYLPGRHGKELKLLREMGIDRISQIPEEFAGLSAKHQRIRRAVIQDLIYLEDELPARLVGAQYPLHFVDFECVMPMIPIYPGTRPYQNATFQWSCHTVASPRGSGRHKEFLHDGLDHPGRAFAESLIQAVGKSGSIITYCTYEKARLNELAIMHPDLGPRIEAIVDRIVDLYKIIESCVYHPGFKGSFSLKDVLPVLVPGLTYNGLAIRDGETAARTFEGLVTGAIPDEDRAASRQALLEYCKLDTLAMVKVWERLLEETSQPGLF